MWLDKIIDAKKKQNITTKMMADRSRIPEQTITRILSKKTEFPRIDTVLDLGASVGLSARELFDETTSVVGDKSIAMLQDELDRANAAFASIQSEMTAIENENALLRNNIDDLERKNDILRVKLECKEEMIRLYERYTTLFDSIAK